MLFRRDSFIPRQGATTSFIEVALAEGKRYEERVAQDLSGAVFENVFPSLIEALADATNQELSQVREAAFTFLYRLLFILYAEDRGLLPVNDPGYDDYGLRKRVRDDIARRTEAGSNFSAKATNYYDHLTTLCKIIDKGDPSIGIPPYNGGLFAEDATPLLAEVHLTDKAIAPIVYNLSHTKTAEGRHFVNYRDMSVQQLGSIYERLLEQEPVRTDQGEIIIRPNSYARKDSGSYFTPQELVDLIVNNTLKPLAEERLAAFEAGAKELEGDPRPAAERQADLVKLDPAEAVLNLKVLDPAMGSGHFLVTAVDFSIRLYRRPGGVHSQRPHLAEGRICLAANRPHSSHQAGHHPAGHGIQLDPGPKPANRPDNYQADGTEALHLRRGQKPLDRRTGKGIPVAPQLHRRGAVVISGPPSSVWRLAGWPHGYGSHAGTEPFERAVRQFRHRRSRNRHGRNATDRGKCPTPTYRRSRNRHPCSRK